MGTGTLRTPKVSNVPVPTEHHVRNVPVLNELPMNAYPFLRPLICVLKLKYCCKMLLETRFLMCEVSHPRANLRLKHTRSFNGLADRGSQGVFHRRR